MARIGIDGFEDNNLSFWPVNNSPTVQSSAGYDMSGNYCVYSSSQYGKHAFDSAYPEIYGSFRWRPVHSTNAQRVFSFYDEDFTNPIAFLTHNSSSGKMELRRGAYNGTLLATGTKVIQTTDVTYLIDFYYKPLNSGGVFTVKVDGVQDVTYSGDTTNLKENCKMVSFGHDGYVNARYDDFRFDDADWIGDTRIQGLAVTGAGNYAQWDPSTGNNYECVDETIVDDDDYVSTNVTNEIDTYALGDLTGDIESIKCVQVQARMAYQGAVTPTKQDLLVRSNSTDDPSGSTISPGVAFVNYQRIWETDPGNGDIAWSESNVNALEVGVKAIA